MRKFVAGNPNTTSDILKKLATDADVEVKRNVVFHDKVTPEILEILSNDPDGNVSTPAKKILNQINETNAENSRDDYDPYGDYKI